MTDTYEVDDVTMTAILQHVKDGYHVVVRNMILDLTAAAHEQGYNAGFNDA